MCTTEETATDKHDLEHASLAVLASTDADYERYGVARERVEAFEDGARTDGRAGTYEWWYFDAHLDDDAKLVVVFMDKDLASPQKPLAPLIRLNLDLADGRSFEKLATFEPEAWSAATDHADVRIAGNRFSGDLHRYRITASVDEIEVDVTLVGQIPPWRPGTGHLLYGPKRDLEFGWLPAVPQGTVTATYRVGDETHTTTGIGYHDHNWGNVGLMEIINDWYWARGQAGPYSVIASSITAHKNYDYAPVTVFMLAKDGKVVADDGTRTLFETDDYSVDPLTGKPVANVTRYRYHGDGETYVVTFTRHIDLTRSRLIDGVHGFKRLAAELVRFDGAYLRFAGELHIQRIVDDRVVEEYSDEAIWELMYFGHARAEAGPAATADVTAAPGGVA
jgi:predicted secreted hydrolase